MGFTIIFELGQNHNGSLDEARLLVDLTKHAGADMAKLQIRNLEHEMTPSMAAEKYTSKGSFGNNYMDHRKKLELSKSEYVLLSEYIRSVGLKLCITYCNVGIVDWIVPDLYKIASRDMQNIPLLGEIGFHAHKNDKPVCLSTGCATSRRDIFIAVKELTKYVEPSKVYIMHCTSEYPTKPENVRIGNVSDLIAYYPGHRIGFSDHTIGIKAGVMAAALGATIFEKHITSDREQKGSDHYCSLGPDGMKRYVRDIREAEKYLTTEYFPADYEKFLRLTRSLAYKRDMKKGAIVRERDLIMVSPGTGKPYAYIEKIVGRTLTRDVKKNEHVD